MSKFIHVSDDRALAPHNVGWLSSTGHTLLRLEHDLHLSALADWLAAYGKKGTQGTGHLLVPELSAWMLGDDTWEQGLIQLGRIIMQYNKWLMDNRNVHFLALRDRLDYGLSAHCSPWIG